MKLIPVDTLPFYGTIPIGYRPTFNTITAHRNNKGNIYAGQESYLGTNIPHNRLDKLLPAPPPWRVFTRHAREAHGLNFRVSEEEIELVNAALYLRRPLLITGRPGTGKSTLAYAVAHELQLGPVLLWPITTRSTLQQGLYSYDAIARLQDTSLHQSSHFGEESNGNATPLDIGRYIRLGPVGTALLPASRPRVLLIDEIDKSDVDLPNDLLHIFEEGRYEIPELVRMPQETQHVGVLPYDSEKKAIIERGRVQCDAFPFVVLTSNGEREFPPAFLRRCLRLEIPLPDRDKLVEIVTAHLQPGVDDLEKIRPLITEFIDRRDKQRKDLSTDQLLNAIYLVMKGIDPLHRDRAQLVEALLRSLSEGGMP